MPFHFAAARCARRSPVARALARKPVRVADNDNPNCAIARVEDAQVLTAALRHFARHGLRAAASAAELAKDARNAGKLDSFAWWRAICATLDHALAEELISDGSHRTKATANKSQT